MYTQGLIKMGVNIWEILRTCDNEFVISEVNVTILGVISLCGGI